MRVDRRDMPQPRRLEDGGLHRRQVGLAHFENIATRRLAERERCEKLPALIAQSREEAIAESLKG